MRDKKLRQEILALENEVMVTTKEMLSFPKKQRIKK